MSEQVTENVQGTDSKKKKKGLLVLVLAIALVGAIAFTLLATGGVIVSGEARTLARELKKDGTTTIVLDEDVTISGPLVVNGKKTITGNGKITISEKAKIDWPELEEIKTFGGVGCATVKTHDTSIMPAMFVVSPNAELTIAGSVGADAANRMNVCQVQGTGSFTLKDKATLENGRYCNVDVQDKAEFTVKGGKTLNGTRFNVINKGTTAIDGGTISGTVEKNGAAVYSASKLVVSDGLVEKSACHNIYVAAGEFEMTGGSSGFSKADGIIVKQDATANITGGSSETHTKHGIHNDGKMTLGKATVIESGIVNGPKGTLDLDGTYVKGSYVFALANEGGTVTGKNFSTKNCEATAICNLSGKMDLKDINLEGGRDGNISIITGEVNIEGAVLDKCREKSVSISGGNVNIKNIDIQGTSGKFNGVYVFGGELYMEDATIANTGDCGFRVDQAGFAEVKNVTIKDTTSTAIFGGRGTIVMDGVTAENIGGHGVYNTGGKVTISNFNIKKVRNVIQQRNGETIINNIVADEMELGAYCQEGLLSINGGKFTNSASNGLRVKEKTTGGLPTLELKNVTISDVAFHGISNMGIFKGENVTIKNTGMNGFYNKETAKATVKGLKVSNVTAYGISNGLKANLNMSDVSVENVGLNKENNAVHNLGTMTVKGLNIKKNQRNGIYNVGKLTGSDITITDVKENGIYNNTDVAKTGFKGYFDVTNVTVYSVGSQGVSNMRESTFKAKNLVVYDVPENGVRNHKEGIAIIDGGKIYNVDKHGINNDQSTLTLSNFEIYDVNRAEREFNLLNNSGKLTGNNISLYGKAFRALYTNAKGTVSITGLKADGAGLSNVMINGKLSESKCVVSNNAGVMTLKDSKITNAKEMALYTISGAKTTLNNVAIDKAGTHGISAQGNTTTNATNLTIKNVTGTAIYNNGVMTSKGLTIEDCMHGVSCRSNGRTTLAGNTVIKNMEKTAIQTWGDEKKSNDNRITVAENAKVTIDGTGYHAVLNRGQLLMYKSASINVKNVGGVGSNAIYNHNADGTVAPVMKLGTVTVSNIKSEAKDATVVGDAIANRGELTLLGDVTVSDFHASGTSMGTDRNYAAIMNMNGTIKGNANVTVLGEAEEGVLKEDTLVTGVYVEGGTVSLGNITVKNARSHGIQVKKAGTLTLANGAKVDIDTTAKHAILNAGTFITDETSNISIKNVGGTGSNAIYNHNSEGTVTPVMKLGTVTVSDIKSEAKDATVVGDAIANRGELTLLGDVTVSDFHASGTSMGTDRNYAAIMNMNGTIKGNANVTVLGEAEEGVLKEDTLVTGVYVEGGNVSLGNITVKNARSHGIQVKKAGTLTLANGAKVDIDTTAKHAILNAGTFITDETSNISIKNVGGTGSNAIYNHNSEGTVTPVMKLGTVTVSDIKSEAKDATVVGDAIANRGELTLLGDVTVSDFHASGTSMGTDRNYAAIMNMNGTIKGNANVTVLGEAEEGVLKEDTLVTGVYVEGGTVSLGNITVKNARSHGIQVKKAGALTLANGAKVDIDTTGKHAILNAGTFITDETSNISIKNVGGTGSNAIYNFDYDNSMTPVMKLGKVTVEGINVESNASVQGNAIANRGELTLLGDVTVSGIHASGANVNSNRNYAGITNFVGNIKGENSNVTITGEVTEGVVNEDTMAFGVFVEEGTVTLGNIKVTNARQRAVHIGNEGKAATLNAKDIVIDYSADRGIYMQNKTCAINVTESISVNKTGNHGIFAPSPITVGKDVTIKNVAGKNNANGFHVDAAVKVGGNILIDGVSGVTNGDNQGNGLVVTSAGTLDVEGNVTIKNITSTGTTNIAKPATAATNGLFTRGNTTIKGEVVIDNVVKGNAVLCTNALLKIEKLTITNATNREAILIYSNGKAEINGGSITGAYGTTASDDDPDLGIVTVRNAAAKVTLNNFTIKDTGGCQYGIVTRIDSPTVETTNLTLEGCGIMSKGGAGKYTLNGTTTIKDYDENGIHLIQTGSVTLPEGAVLNISHPGDKNHAEAIYLNNSGTINGPKATVNISDIKGENGHGIHMVGTRSVAATLLVGAMKIDNCAQYAITADKEVKNIDKVYIGLLKVTNCGFENALKNVNSNCYVLAP